MRAPGADALEAALERHAETPAVLAAALRDLVSDVPQLTAVQLFLGFALDAAGHRKEAIAALRAVAAGRRAGFDCLCLAADALTAWGTPEEAVAACTAALEIAPHASHAYLRRGRASAVAGDVTAAVEDLRHATLLQPSLVEAHLALARELRAAGRAEAAADSYRRALVLAPASEEAQRGLDAALCALVPPWHAAMLNDGVRAAAYDSAIRRAVRPGMHVLDIGTGTGLLAMMAARAGAARVTACESVGPLAGMAQEIIQNKGLEDKIKVVNKSCEALDAGADLGGRADLLVAEIVDAGLLSERVLAAFADARARLLAPGAPIIPRGATVYAVPVESEALYAARRVGRVAGFDLSAFNALAPRLYLQAELRHYGWRPLAAPAPVFAFDFRNPDPEPAEAAIDITATADGTAQLVAFWFVLALDDETALSTGPDAPPTHWQQAVYALDAPFPVRAGDGMRIDARHDGNTIRLAVAPADA